MRNLLILISLIIVSSCNNETYSPKPRGFYRINFPEKQYVIHQDGCPFTFEIPKYSELKTDQNKNAQNCWKNLEFPEFNAKLHLSYFELSSDATLEELAEDARTFVFKHTTKASSIDQKLINKSNSNVYGLEYYIQGNTASNYQFYVSDSSKNYLRAALYFNEKPNIDSIQPVLDFIKTDIEHLINTIRWK